MTISATSKCMHVAVKDCAVLSEIFRRLEGGEKAEAVPIDSWGEEKRSAPRCLILAPGLARLVKVCGEIMAFPVKVKNISRCGMLLEFQDKGHVSAGMLTQIESLDVTILLDGNEAVTVECLPKRIVLDGPIGLGVQVSECPSGESDPKRFLM